MPQVDAEDSCHISEWYGRLMASLRLAMQEPRENYAWWFNSNSNPLSPTASAQRLLEIRRNDHREAADYFAEDLRWLRDHWCEVEHSYLLARADLRSVDYIPAIERDTASRVACALLRQVEGWHNAAQATICNLAYDDDEPELFERIRGKLEESDAEYPIRSDAARRLIDDLAIEQSYVMRAREAATTLPRRGGKGLVKGIEELFEDLSEDDQEELWIYLDWTEESKKKPKGRTPQKKKYFDSRIDLKEKYSDLDTFKKAIDKVSRWTIVKSDPSLRKLKELRSKNLGNSHPGK